MMDMSCLRRPQLKNIWVVFEYKIYSLGLGFQSKARNTLCTLEKNNKHVDEEGGIRKYAA